MADKNPFASVGLGMFGSEGGQGGLGQDALAMAMAYGIDKTGLKDALNSKGFAKNAQGQWGYSAPVAPPSLSGGLNYQNGSDIGGGVVPPQASAPVAPTIQQAVVPNAAPTTPAPVSTTPPAGIGNKILDNDWHGSDNSDQQQQNQFASQSTSEFVPTMGYKPDYASDRLKQFAQAAMMG
jgi:hypothetical protein